MAAAAKSSGPRSGAAALLTTTGFGGGSGFTSATGPSPSAAGSTEGAARAAFLQIGAREGGGGGGELSFGEKGERRKESLSREGGRRVFFSLGATPKLGMTAVALFKPLCARATNFLFATPVDLNFYSTRVEREDSRRKGSPWASACRGNCRHVAVSLVFPSPTCFFSPTTRGQFTWTTLSHSPMRAFHKTHRSRPEAG